MWGVGGRCDYSFESHPSQYNGLLWLPVWHRRIPKQLVCLLWPSAVSSPVPEIQCRSTIKVYWHHWYRKAQLAHYLRCWHKALKSLHPETNFSTIFIFRGIAIQRYCININFVNILTIASAFLVRIGHCVHSISAHLYKVQWSIDYMWSIPRSHRSDNKLGYHRILIHQF